MSISSSKLDLIRPSIFRDESGVDAWFTLKNSNGKTGDKLVPGLDLGQNTHSSSKTILKNRDLLFRELGLDPDLVAFANQVHGTRIRFVTAGGTYPETDGLITNIPGLALAIQVADCAAVLLADPNRRLIAAVHAGWRGAAGGIVPRAIDVMRENGGYPTEIKGFVSPCISVNNLEVGEEVAEQFPDRFVNRQSYNKPHVDLKQYLKQQMLEAGMSEDHIEVNESCTIEEADRFYSYRREKERSGRMLGIIKFGL